jgi:iron complex outermembrane receptor protein
MKRYDKSRRPLGKTSVAQRAAIAAISISLVSLAPGTRAEELQERSITEEPSQPSSAIDVGSKKDAAVTVLPPINVQPEKRPRRPKTADASKRRSAKAASHPQNSASVTSLDPIIVRAQTGLGAPSTTTATKTDTPLIEAPQSVSVVTRSQMEIQNPQSVEQALRYNAGIVPESFDSDVHASFGSVRGFALMPFLGGLPLFNGKYATWRLEPYGLNRLDLIRGPSTALFGQNPPGGLINAAPKFPTLSPTSEIILQGGTHARRQAQFDFGGPVSGSTDWNYRLVGLGRLADTQVQYARDDRIFFAPSASWSPSIDTSLTIFASLQRDWNNTASEFWPAEGTVLPNTNGTIPRSRFVSEPGFDGLTKSQYLFGYQFQHRFGEHLQFRQNLHYGRLDSDSNGAFSIGWDWLDPSKREVARLAHRTRERVDGVAIDNQLQTNLTTGPFQHSLLFGIDYFGSSASTRSFQTLIAPLDVFTPRYGAPVDFPNTPHSFTDQSLHQVGFYAQDQVRFDRFLLTLSGRQDRTDNKLGNRLTNVTTSADNSPFTYRAGITYLTDLGIAPYASYATSFSLFPGTDAAGNAFQPLTADQIEVGIKYQPPGSNALVTVAGFDLTQQNVRTRDPENPLYQIQTGEIRSRGVEFEAVGDLKHGLGLIASYTFQDVEITKSSFAAEIGKHPAGVPQHMARLWLDYRIQAGPLEGLRLGGGLRYLGPAFGTSTNRWDFAGYEYGPSRVDAHTLVDAAVSYGYNNVRFSLNASNLFDTKHFTCIAGTCNYGPSRSFIASMRATW